MKFELPCYIKSGSKTISLSLNWYRNAHYRQSNNMKKKFKEIIKPQLDKVEPIEGQISIKFVYYAARNNSPDLDNFTSVVKKFFQDALVELDVIPEDNVNYITSTSEFYGGLDRENPRVEAFITINSPT